MIAFEHKVSEWLGMCTDFIESREDPERCDVASSGSFAPLRPRPRNVKREHYWDPACIDSRAAL